MAALMAAESFPSRTAAGRRVCEAFGFRDARGGLQQAGCVESGCRVLEAAGPDWVAGTAQQGRGEAASGSGGSDSGGGGGTGAGGCGGGTEAGSGEGGGGSGVAGMG